MAFMRLLQRNPNGDTVFRESANPNDVPAYAILSHTWCEEEVTFHDMDTGAGRSNAVSKAGWWKIQFYSQQAAADGLQYFWVDTCCIDKKNAVELSAAINSMIRWYQNAARCYVFMSDVSKPTPENENESIWIGHFRASRWFHRGWTLQQLIAPTIVKFFSLEGNAMGYESTIEQELHNITQISVRALRRSSRSTTLDEDIVYRLLGIFKVFIPPIYGEGRANALSRLQEALNQRHKQPVVDTAAGASGSSGLRNPDIDKLGIDVFKARPGHTEDTGYPLSNDTSPYGKYRSLASVKPELDIPTKEIQQVIDNLTDRQHVLIVKVVTDNCRRAAFDFFSENALWRTKFSRDDGPNDPKLFQLPNGRFQEKPEDLNFRAWIRKIQSACSRVNEPDAISVRMVRDMLSKDRYHFGNALDMTKMVNVYHRLDPLELESCLCYAIAWCWHLYASKYEARLKLLWAELHPATIDENWRPNLGHVLEHVKVNDWLHPPLRTNIEIPGA